MNHSLHSSGKNDHYGTGVGQVRHCLGVWITRSVPQAVLTACEDRGVRFISS